jgi:hypothetical protein
MTIPGSMNVYFSDTGEIKAITPAVEEYLAKDFNSAAFAISTVEPFLLGKMNLTDFRVVSAIEKDVRVYKLEKKNITVSYIRSLDNYLTKIEALPLEDTAILITNDIANRTISLEILKDSGPSNNEVEGEPTFSEFLNLTNSEIYITDRNNPYVLLQTISFSPNRLRRERIMEFRYVADCSNSSAYTKKIISGYSYIERT